MILALLTLIIGILTGYYCRELLEALKEFIRYIKPLASGVVRPNKVNIIKPIATARGAVRAKSPKEVAYEKERKFREDFGL